MWRNIRRFEVLGRSIMPVAMGLALASGLSVAGISQATQSRSSSDAAMRQHYDAAYRYQAAGDTSSADREHKLFLSQALHHVANARANIVSHKQPNAPPNMVPAKSAPMTGHGLGSTR